MKKIDVNKFIRENMINDTIRYRQKFHIMAPIGLINDPNGFCKFKDKYFLFYQTHPFKAYHGTKYWAQITSKDLVNWDYQGIAIEPEYWFEKDGCFSGNTFIENDKMYLFYTGNIWENGKEFVVGEEYQCLAISEDGYTYKKLSEPIIMAPDFSEFTPHHRDPKVWKHDNIYYMIVGAQRIGWKPAIMMYYSEDLINWKQKGVLLEATQGPYSKAYMWECPGYAHIDGRDVLFISPQGMTYEGDLTENRHQSGYVIGDIDYDRGIFNCDNNYNLLDYGFEFYAPQIFTEDNGRHLCIAWMGLPDQDDHPTRQDNWLHCLSLPTELKMKKGKLYRSPIKELERLRKNQVDMNLNLSDTFKAECFEMLIEFNSNSDINIYLRGSQNMDSFIHLYYRSTNHMIVLDRNKSNETFGGTRAVKLNGNSDKIKLNIFVDVSSIEIFINDGEYVLSTRVFTGRDDINNKILLSEDDSISLVRIWELG